MCKYKTFGYTGQFSLHIEPPPLVYDCEYVDICINKPTFQRESPFSRWKSHVVKATFEMGERSGSVVECLTRDRGAAGLSLAASLHCAPYPLSYISITFQQLIMILMCLFFNILIYMCLLFTSMHLSCITVNYCQLS